MIFEGFFQYVSAHPSVLIGAFLFYVFVFFLSILFNRKRPGRNPFYKNQVKPREKLVTDIKARDAVIKQRFMSAKVPEDLDAIVIGSGYGGLSTAALLARAGKKVLVLEQHDQAGGCCHTYYSKKGFEFDTGIHYIGNMGERESHRFFLDQLTNGQIDWVPMADNYDTVVLGEASENRKYKMLRGREECIRELKKNFPKDHEAIDKYMDLIMKARAGYTGLMMLKYLPKWLCRILILTGIIHWMSEYFKYSQMSVIQVLDSLTDNIELKATLSYIFGDYGIPPKEAAFSFHGTLVGHYLGGAYYPRGGPSEIAYQTIPVIESAGGRVLVQAPVSKILINSKGHAVGVTVKKVTGEIDINAKFIISDAGVINTFQHLLPPSIATKSCIYPMIEKLGSSCSFITAFLGLEGTTEELNLHAGNIWYFTQADIDGALKKFLTLDVDDLGHHDFPLLYISSPSAKDPSFQDRFPGRSVVLVITLAKYEWFVKWQNERVKHRGDEYATIKEKIGGRIIEQCIQLNPQLKDKVTLLKIGTPVTNNHYLGTKRGEMYGLNHSMERFSPEVSMTLRPKTDIPGLYLTGQDIVTCGFVSVLYAGLLTASTILHRNLMTDLHTLRKQVIKAAKEKNQKKIE